MSRVIRLPDAIVEEVMQFLERKGIPQATSISKNIQRCLSIAMYETPHIQDGREIAGQMEGDVSPLLKGRVAAWTEKVDWNKPEEQGSSLSPEVRQSIRESTEELTDELKPQDEVFREGEEDQIATPTVEPSKPPWTYLNRIEMDEIKRLWPTHPAIKWPGQDKVKRMALECAFGVVPQSLNRSTKLMEIAYALEEEFKSWEKCL